jgi:putative IMPACT (imprinted ancient) family translation regulator
MINVTARDNELEALKSIYQEAFTSTLNIDGSVMITYTHNCEWSIKLTLPVDYPEHSKPSFCISILHVNGLSKTTKAALENELHQLIDEHNGNEMAFIIIEFVKDRLHELFGSENVSEAVDVKQETDLEIQNFVEEDVKSSIGHMSNVEVIHGPIIEDRKSQFQAHFSVVTSMDDVHSFREVVLSDRKVARATHNIFAYRFTCPRTGVSYHDNDDDGETAAGGRLAEMIRLMKIDGVAIIVTRWFGGTLLGPDRFKLINNTARNLLEENRLGSTMKKKHS